MIVYAVITGTGDAKNSPVFQTKGQAERVASWLSRNGTVVHIAKLEV